MVTAFHPFGKVSGKRMDTPRSTASHDNKRSLPQKQAAILIFPLIAS